MEQVGKEELFLGKKRNLDLKNFNISEYAYKELQYFCMQYGEKKKMIEEGISENKIKKCTATFLVSSFELIVKDETPSGVS